MSFPDWPGLMENVAVCIRVRPLTAREAQRGDADVLATDAARQLVSVCDSQGRALPGKSNAFQYDHIFDARSSTADMYARVARRIVRSTLEGINGTVFAYGQTSSGKTFTMQGEEGFAPGFLPLAVEDIFRYIEQSAERDFLLRVSFVEIYNEVVRDLLAGGDNLKLREDPRKGVYVDCHEEIITDYDGILQLLRAGNERRAVGTTAMNERSSRSHSIFRIVIESKSKVAVNRDGKNGGRTSDADEAGAVLVASLNLVDLAGSESLRHTGAEGIRQREAGNINKSLLTLSRVINSLAGSGDGGIQNAPFRDSKLTRLLQNSLGGNTRTLIVCCVTPSERYVEETRSTLQFAARAKNIQISATVNEILDDQAQLRLLKREVNQLKKSVNGEQLSALKAENEALISERERHKAEIDRLTGLILSSASLARQRAMEGAGQRPRSKRSRETWCPGDFPSSFKDRGFNVIFSPRKRLSVDAKENRNPQQEGDVENDVAMGDAGSRKRASSSGSDANGDFDGGAVEANRLWVELLTHALDNPGEYVTADLWKALAGSMGSQETRQHALELLNKLRIALGSGTSTDSGAAADVQLASAKADNNALEQQLEVLQISLAEKEEIWKTQQQELKASLEAAEAEIDEFRARVSRTAGNDTASAVPELAKMKRQLKKSQMELARIKEEQERREELHREVLTELESGYKGSIEELSKQLEESYTEIEETKLIKEQVAQQLEVTFGKKLEETQQQLEESHRTIYHLQQQLEEVKASESANDAAEKDVLLSSKAELEMELQNVVKSMEEGAQLLAEREQEIVALKARLDTTSMEGTETPELDQSTVEKEALLSAKLKLEEQVEHLTSRQTQLQDQTKMLSEDNSELQENVEELQCRIDTLLKEKQVLEASSQPSVVLSGDVNEISGELQGMLSELAQLRNSFETSEKENHNLSETKDTLMAELDQLRSIAAEKEHSAKVLQAQLDAKLMTISQLQSKRSAETTAFQEEKERLMMQQHDDDKAKLEEEVVALAERNAQLLEELESLRLGSGSKSHANLSAQEDVAMESSEDNEQTHLRDQLAALQVEHNEVVDTLSALRKHADQLSAELAAEKETNIGDDNNGTLPPITELREALQNVTKERDELAESLAALEEQLMLESQEKMQLIATAEEHRALIREADEKISEIMDREQEAAANVASVESLGYESGGSDEAIRRQLEAQEQTRARLELDVKSYEETLALLRSELKDKSYEVTQLGEKLKAAENAVTVATRREEALQKEIKTLSTAVERSNEERVEMLAQMKQRLVAGETREVKLMERLERLQGGSSAGTFQAETEQLENAVAHLKQELTTAQSTLENGMQAYNELQQRLNASEMSEQEHKEQVEMLLQQLEEAKQAFESVDAEWRDKCESLREEAMREIENLREDLQTAQEELDAHQKFAENEMSPLRSSLESAESELLELTKVHEACGSREETQNLRLEEQEQLLAELKIKHQELEEVCDALENERQERHQQHERDIAELRASLVQSGNQEDVDALKEALRAAKREVRHFHDQLVEAQLAKERDDQRIATQQARIVKLEKVKMTTETLEVFRKLKSDRQMLQNKVEVLQEQLRSGGGAGLGRHELENARNHIEELQAALRAEKQRVNDLRSTLLDERDKNSHEMDSMRELLRSKVAEGEELSQRVEALSDELLRGQSNTREQTSYLERENLELHVEVRRLKKQLQGGNQADDDTIDTKVVFPALLGQVESENRAELMLASSSGTESPEEREAKTSEQSAKPQCAQQ